MRRELVDVADSIRKSKKVNKKGCTLLIGAGCSVKAGIPTASEFVDVIGKEFKLAYRRATIKTYPYVMAELTFAQRYHLINRYINSAKLNWAYLAIAQLFKKGYVDRVLTVNFDPLLLRACALVGVFPAIYDFAASQNFNSDLIARQSVFYLHGQHTGFVLLNTPAEVKRFSRYLNPMFLDSVKGRVSIVVGYSGENDPVFDHLAKIAHYHNGLYWICFKDTPPQPHVQKEILIRGKDSFFVQGYDADDFFVGLAQELDCFPPDFVLTPFTHLEKILEVVVPYALPGKDSGLDAIPKKLLKDAIERIEKPATLALSAKQMLLKGNFEAVIAMRSEEKLTDELAELIAWGYVSAGNKAVSEAQTTNGKAADKLWALAGENYEAALIIKPDKHQALFNWGTALSLQAQTINGEKADDLWALAGEKYAAALKIKPDKHQAFYNWAGSLVYQARTKSGNEAERLWRLAYKKYAAVLKIKTDHHDALYDWGSALRMQAGRTSGKEAERLWELSGQKYAAALRIKPDKHEALNTWGTVLSELARMKSGKEADGLWALAGKKYAAALKIKPDKYQALYNWAGSLAYQARSKRGKDAERLWKLAHEKFQVVLKIKTDHHNALYDWGVALMTQASTKKGKEAERLLELAGKRFAAALQIKPDKHQALNNWGVVLSAQARTKSGNEADRLWALAGKKYAAALKIKPDKHQAQYGWGIALRTQAERKKGPEADRLRKLADAKIAAARAIAPELYPSD